MKKSLAFVIVSLLAGPAASAQTASPPPMPAPPATGLPVVTLEEALRTARENQPQVRAARANTEAAGARSYEALSPLLPQVTGTATYSRKTANFAPSPGALPSSVNVGAGHSADTFNYYSFGVTATQMVYDFGHSIEQYNSARDTESAQRQSERTTAAQVALAVEAAYFNARAQKALMGVAKETFDNQDKHLQQTVGFVKAGTQPEIALAQAKTNLANAQVQLVNADNAYDLAKATLNQAMGVEGSTAYEVADESLEPVDGEDKDTEALMPEALQARPEMAVLRDQIRAQEATVKSVLGTWGPAIGVATSLTDAGTELNHDHMAWNWNGLVTLSWQLVQGGLTVAQTREAKANVAVLKAQADLEQQQVRVDVETARLGVRAAKAAIDAVVAALVNAREQLRLAEARFTTGVGNSIELTDAQLALTSAEAQKVQADFNLSAARAQLLKALGRR